MSAIRWIHCNICFHLLAKKERKFYHLSCRHVLCRECMSKTDRGTVCPICKQRLECFTEINNKMERKDKMFYDPSSLKLLSVVNQSIIFQHKQRENMIRGILRCRIAIARMKEVENVLGPKVVEMQRRYEKMRAYRRNLQETLRQISPRYLSRPVMDHGGRAPLQQLPVNRQQQGALANRKDDPACRRHQEHPRQSGVMLAAATLASPGDFSFGSPSPIIDRPPSSAMNSSFTSVQRVSTQGSSNTDFFVAERNKPGRTTIHEGKFADDSGISSMQTPSSCISFASGSRMMSAQQIQQQLPHPFSPSTPVRHRSGVPHSYRPPGQILTPSMPPRR